MEKYIISLKGLCCENCGEKIRRETEALEGIAEAKMNVMAQKMTVMTENDIKPYMDRIEVIVKSHESEVEVSLEKNAIADNEDEKDDIKKEAIKIIVGGIIFVAGYLLGGTLGMVLYVISYLLLGVGVIKDGLRSIIKGHAMDENFLMSLATIGAFAINEPTEAVFVMLFYSIGELFEELAVKRSRSSIKSLMELCPDKAYVEENGELVEKDPEDVYTGDVIVIRAGERVPLDCEIIDGESELDYSALSGESAPVFAEKGCEVLSGSINNTGVLRARVIRPFGESTVSEILDMVENAASKKTPAETFITTFSRVYTPIVVCIAALMGLFMPIFTGDPLAVWFHRALMFLVVSCPCALVLSVPLAYFAGIGEASRKGILIKGSAVIKALTEVEAVIMDKTGTLTEGVFKVERVVTAEGIDEHRLNRIASEAESMSNHPVAKAISAYTGKADGGYSVTEIAGRGVKAEKDGRIILAGNKRLMDENGIEADESDTGCAVIYVAENGIYLGRYDVSDTIKSDSAEAIRKLRLKGKDVYMLTGDNEASAKKVAKELGIGYRASLLPEDKTKFVEELNEKSIKTVFVGDGINDAPSLMTAYVGIAMGRHGTDAAIEAADCVIMTDEPMKVAKAIDIAEKTESIVKQNIVFSLCVKIAVLILGAVGAVGMNAAVFADVGVALIAVLNSMRRKA